MKRSTRTRWAVRALVILAACAAAHAGELPPGAETGAPEATWAEQDAARLERAARALRGGNELSAGEARVALSILVQLAVAPPTGVSPEEASGRSGPSKVNTEARALLNRALGDPRPEVARAAGEALETMRRLLDSPVSHEAIEAGAIRRRDARRAAAVEALVQAVADTDSPHRGRDASLLYVAAGSRAELPPDLQGFFAWMARDPEPEVARWGELVVARAAGREPDPALVPRYRPSPERRRLERQRREETLTSIGDPRPEMRLTALMELVAATDGPASEVDAEALEALTRAAVDPDPAVAAFARWRLLALAGDPHAAGRVFVRGESLAWPAP